MIIMGVILIKIQDAIIQMLWNASFRDDYSAFLN